MRITSKIRKKIVISVILSQGIDGSFAICLEQLLVRGMRHEWWIKNQVYELPTK